MITSCERCTFGKIVRKRCLNGQPAQFHLDLFEFDTGRLRVPRYLTVRTVPVNDTGVQRYFPVLQTFLQGHVQRFIELHLDRSALFVWQIRSNGARERRRRFVAPGLTVFLGMFDLID